MTHGSSSSNKLTDDYQELELLCDFVLNLLISRQLEKQSRNSLMAPGAIALPTNADATKKIKSSFDEKYGDNWMEMSLMKRTFEMLKYKFFVF